MVLGIPVSQLSDGAMSNLVLNASCGTNIDGEAPILIRNEQRQRAHPRPKRRHGLGSRRELYRQLWGFADPRPDPWQAVKGIEHKNLLHPEPEAREYMHWQAAADGSRRCKRRANICLTIFVLKTSNGSWPGRTSQTLKGPQPQARIGTSGTCGRIFLRHRSFWICNLLRLREAAR